MPTIKAAVCHEFGAPLVVQDVQLAPPGHGEIEITLSACAICHSDISFAEGGWGGALPAVYGHEAAGRISGIGPGVTGYQIGDTVLATLIRACGTCAPCATGEPAYCATPYDRNAGPLTTVDNGPLQHGLAIGAFAEKVVVDQSQIAAIPPGMPMDAASLLSCGVITGVGAVVNTAGLHAGQVAVVIGAGGVGLNAIQGARIAGASRIIAVDMTPEKLAVAREFGATDGVLATDPKPWKAARQAAGRAADAVFVTVGAIPAYDTAARYLGPGGKLVMVGMPHSGEKSDYEPEVIASLGQSLIGTKMGDVVLKRDIPWMVDLYQQGRLKLGELVSGRWRLDQINEAIADTKTGTARRNVIVFD
jgi:S-(hydroxymethyl)glutathione dehydrogenase/alcohol dehydrogenase